MTGLLPLALLGLLVAVSAQAPAPTTPAQKPATVRYSPCEQEAPRLVGETAIRIAKGMRYPRKIHDAKIKWPTTGNRRVGGPWIGEALIEPDGVIHHVWTLRDLEATPPWPEANAAIIAAIKQWTFTPTKVNGRPVPVCMAISVNINLQ